MRALKYLEAPKPHLKAFAEKQHIDYHFGGMDDETNIHD